MGQKTSSMKYELAQWAMHHERETGETFEHAYREATGEKHGADKDFAEWLSSHHNLSVKGDTVAAVRQERARWMPVLSVAKRSAIEEVRWTEKYAQIHEAVKMLQEDNERLQIDNDGLRALVKQYRQYG